MGIQSAFEELKDRYPVVEHSRLKSEFEFEFGEFEFGWAGDVRDVGGQDGHSECV
jgi:hypothetical protein